MKRLEQRADIRSPFFKGGDPALSAHSRPPLLGGRTPPEPVLSDVSRIFLNGIDGIDDIGRRSLRHHNRTIVA